MAVSEPGLGLVEKSSYQCQAQVCESLVCNQMAYIVDQIISAAATVEIIMRLTYYQCGHS